MNAVSSDAASKKNDLPEPLTAEQLRLLGEIGYMAAGSGQRAQAEQIFSNLKVLRPNSAVPYVGLAMARLNTRDFEGAIRVLKEEGMRNVSDNTEVKVFLGLALRLANRVGEADRVLKEVTAQHGASEEPEIKMAREILNGGVKSR